ncbi:MAG: hypothetical protein ABFC57_10840 [Veillonellales bacterium]
MPEKDFQREVIDRLARIETKQDATGETVKAHALTLSDHETRITRTEESTKSAHHRLNGILALAGILGSTAGAAVNWVIAVWSKTGGGGHS